MVNKFYKCILVDDEIEAMDVLEELLKPFPEFKIIAKEKSVDNALQSIVQSTPDLLILDIEMPGMNGFDLVHQLQSLHMEPEIIFITAYNQYAIQAFKVAAFDYLLKPVDPNELEKALIRFRTHQEKDDLRRKIDMLLNAIPGFKKIMLHTRKGHILINPNDILYCEADANYCDVYLTNKQKVVVSRNLGDFSQQLPTGQFFRINRSVVVNLTYLIRIDQRTRKCFLKYEDWSLDFQIPTKYIRKLEKEI